MYTLTCKINPEIDSAILGLQNLFLLILTLARGGHITGNNDNSIIFLDSGKKYFYY